MSTKSSSNPSTTHSTKKLNLPLIYGAFLVVAGALLVAYNISISKDRSLYVVSSFEKPAMISLPGMEPVGVAPGKVRTIRLAEGDYEATITGPVTNKVKFSVKSSFMDRFTKQPAFVLNVGGSVLLFTEEINSEGEISNFKAYFGEEFVSWLNVDVPFTEAPDQIEAGKTLTRLDIFRRPVVEAMAMTAQTSTADDALALAEWHLRLNRGDSRMLSEYIGYTQGLNKLDRMKEFLIEGTKVRPVEIDWHRAYQDLNLTPQDHGKLLAEYDLLLKKDPNNSSLLYLRGRLCLSQKQALDYYNKALMTSFNNAYAHFAIASIETGKGDWTNAMSSIKVARSLRPDVLQFQDILFEARLALGEYPDMERELVEAVQQVPLDTTLNIFLTDVLAASKKHDQAIKVCEEFESRWTQTYNQAPPEQVRSRILYSVGDFDTMVKLYSSKETDDARMAYFEALIEIGRMEEALTVSPIDETGSTDPFHYLAYAIAWKRAGNNERFEACSKRAFELLKGIRPDYALLASLLSDSEAPTVSEVTDLPMVPKLKAISLAYLATKFPEQKAEYSEMARKLNVDRSYPYHLIAKATQ